MGLSVLERIAQNIEQTVATLITQSGYQLSISRAKTINEPAHLKGFIFQLSPTDIADSTIGMDEWRQTFAIVVYVLPTEDDTVAVDSYNNDIQAALYTALMADYHRGGLAINTAIQPTLYFPPVEGEASGITFLFDVHYANMVDHPYVSLSA